MGNALPKTPITLPPEQCDASVWYGPDMLARASEWCIPLLPNEITELEKAAEPWLTSGKNIAGITAESFPLPTLAPKLHAMKNELIHGRGFALLRGLPKDRYTEREAGTMFYGLGSHLGVTRSQNAQGHILGHVRDLGMKSSDPNVRIYQTNERQTFHTDSSDVVALLCLKTAKSGGDSLLVSASTLFNEMHRRRPDLLALLLQPFAVDRRGEVPPGMLPYFMLPVFSYHLGFLTVYYQRQYIDSAQRFTDAPRLTPEQIEALDMFDQLTNDPKIHFSMTLEPGDMQFVYNHTMLHDRTGFEDWPEEKQKRHLLRLWLSIPGDRPLPESFAPRFGTLEPGNRGGIVVANTKLHIAWVTE